MEDTDIQEYKNQKMFGLEIAGWKNNFGLQRTSFEDHGKINNQFHFLITHLSH